MVFFKVKPNYGYEELKYDFQLWPFLPLLIYSAPYLSLHVVFSASYVPWEMGGERGGQGVVPDIWAYPAVCGCEGTALPRLIQLHREGGEVVVQFGVLFNTLSVNGLQYLTRSE